MFPFTAQKEYYTDKIMSNPEWTMVGIFADEGITGTSAQKRPEFLRMIRLCKQGKNDLILTKSISRFARNTVDCLNYIRELKELGIAVIFEKENINTIKRIFESYLAGMSIANIKRMLEEECITAAGGKPQWSEGALQYLLRNEKYYGDALLQKTYTDRRFDSGEGFYGWRDLRYFLYEYEYDKSTQNNLEKVDWNLFTKVEKDKVTIEHILPQTPTKWYWCNQFRLYSDNEIKMLSASLGNLLPLAQSINSSLQNDSFPDKKSPSAAGRRGYVNGSHSEIEVAKEQDWTAQNILTRGLALLKFMESRWQVMLTEEQKMNLLHISFVKEVRTDVPELPEKASIINTNPQNNQTRWGHCHSQAFLR